jgi:hypothetical protein
MLSFKNSDIIFSILSIIFCIFVSAAQLYPEIINIAENKLPNKTFPTAIFESGIKENQLAQLFKNLEILFFIGDSANIIK